MLRIICFFPGFLLKLFELAMNGSRDISNKLRFRNSIVDKNSSFDRKTNLSNNSRVLSNCTFNNVSLGSYSYVGRNSLLQNVTIGKFCSIANNVFIGLGKHPLNRFSTSPLFYKKKNTFNVSLINKDLDFKEFEKIEIGNDVWIGCGAIILDGVKIGDGAVIAAGAVVTKNVDAYEIVAGVPAKKISKRSKIPTNGINWWDMELIDVMNEYL